MPRGLGIASHSGNRAASLDVELQKPVVDVIPEKLGPKLNAGPELIGRNGVARTDLCP